MQIGIDSFAAAISDPATGLTLSPVERMHHLLEEIELADRVGLDVFGWNHFGVEFCADSLAKPVEVTELNLPCRWARFAIVSLRPNRHADGA